MNSALVTLGPYLALILVGFLPNEFWRLLGIVASRSLDEGSELLMWVRAVATAVLAGVISQLILMPPGPLATLPLAARLGAVVVGFAVFLHCAWLGVCRRSGRRTGGLICRTAGCSVKISRFFSAAASFAASFC